MVLMYSRNTKRSWISHKKNQFIDGICQNTEYQTDEFRERLYLLVAANVPDEYVGAVFEAMISDKPLINTAIKYSVSDSQLCRLIKQVKPKWDDAFRGWKFVPPKKVCWLKEKVCGWKK
jgi:hypothetical protein